MSAAGTSGEASGSRANAENSNAMEVDGNAAMAANTDTEILQIYIEHENFGGEGGVITNEDRAKIEEIIRLAAAARIKFEKVSVIAADKRLNLGEHRMYAGRIIYSCFNRFSMVWLHNIIKEASARGKTVNYKLKCKLLDKAVDVPAFAIYCSDSQMTWEDLTALLRNNRRYATDDWQLVATMPQPKGGIRFTFTSSRFKPFYDAKLRNSGTGVRKSDRVAESFAQFTVPLLINALSPPETKGNLPSLGGNTTNHLFVQKATISSARSSVNKPWSTNCTTSNLAWTSTRTSSTGTYETCNDNPACDLNLLMNLESQFLFNLAILLCLVNEGIRINTINISTLSGSDHGHCLSPVSSSQQNSTSLPWLVPPTSTPLTPQSLLLKDLHEPENRPQATSPNGENHQNKKQSGSRDGFLR